VSGSKRLNGQEKEKKKGGKKRSKEGRIILISITLQCAHLKKVSSPGATQEKAREEGEKKKKDKVNTPGPTEK